MRRPQAVNESLECRALGTLIHLTPTDTEIKERVKINSLTSWLHHRLISGPIIISNTSARDKVKRNVVLLCELPKGQQGRPSKALTLGQAAAVLAAAEGTSMSAYIVLSLLIGARTEELRALTWAHVDLEGNPGADPPIPPSIMVWRSVRASGDTKTKKSRRTLAMPIRCADALRRHRQLQQAERHAAGTRWQDNNLVFASKVGTERNSGNVLRSFRIIVARTELNEHDWTPREMRHSFVSLLSDSGVALEDISRLAERHAPRRMNHF